MRPLTILLGLVIAVILVATGVRRLFRMGMQQGYAPAQPIAFSHKLHAGDNQVPCLYCHYGARSSRHAGIPSSSVCMNCHGLKGIDCENCHGAVKTMARVEQVKELTMGFCLTCHREHAGIPTNTLERAAKRFTDGAVTPATGLDCASCHY